MGIAILKTMIAAPTASTVSVWPSPHTIPDATCDGKTAFAANNGRDCDYMVGIRRVPHSHQQSQQRDLQRRSHFEINLRSIPLEGQLAVEVKFRCEGRNGDQ